MPVRLFDPVEQRFLKEICIAYACRGFNAEARSLFNAIQSAFTMNGYERWNGTVPAHPEMVSHLAACAWIALEYDERKQIPWDDGDHDYALTRTLRYFMSTLREAIEKGHTNEIDGKVMHGCFTIPQWYYTRCQENAGAH